jgi:hypothetical protein
MIAAVLPLYAQAPGAKYNERLLFQGLTGVTVGVSQQEWKLSGHDAILQQSAPLMVSIPLANRLLFTATNTPATATTGSYTLEGLTDTRLAFSYVVPGDKLWLSGGVSLPTGKTKLTTAQLPVAVFISQSAFAYRVPIFGQGMNVNAGFAYAYASSRQFIIGFGGSFLYRGEYQPVEVTGAADLYDPGDEISVNGGFDYSSRAKNSRFSFDMTATNYFPDKRGGAKFIQSGIRLMTMAVWQLKWGKSTHFFSIRSRVRTQSEIFSAGTGQQYKSSQHIEGQYSPSIAASQWLTLGATAEGKYYTGEQIPFGAKILETGKAFMQSGGLDISLRFTSWLNCVLSGRYGIGDVTIDDVKYSATGMDLSGSIKILF